MTIEVITADITRRFRKAQGRLKVLSQVPGSEDDVKVGDSPLAPRAP